MALTAKAHDFLEKRRTSFEENRVFLDSDTENSTYKQNSYKKLISRGYPFNLLISAEEKDKENLKILKKW